MFNNFKSRKRQNDIHIWNRLCHKIELCEIRSKMPCSVFLVDERTMMARPLFERTSQIVWGKAGEGGSSQITCVFIVGDVGQFDGK